MQLLAMSATGVHAATVKKIRFWSEPDHTRLVFDLSDSVEYKMFTLSNPDRVVIDIAKSRLADDFSALDFDGGPIKSLRSGTRDGDTLRVVLDLISEVKPSSYTLAANSDAGDRLVIDLYNQSSTTASRDVIDSTVDKPTDTTAADTSQTTTARANFRVDGRRDIVIAISAGHGGNDPGGIGYDGKLREKNVTLAISRALFDQLSRMPGYKPVMIRDGDYYIAPQQRPQKARDHRADLLVAIHTDWYRSSRPDGLTIYALSGDRADRENARRVEEKEQTANLLGGAGNDISLSAWDDDVALTLVSIQMAWSMEQSLIAGTRLLESLDGVTRLRRDKVQQASLEVLKSPDIPSVLIETGYLTNPAEARRLNTSRFQQRLAAAITQGVMNYFYEAPPIGSLVAWQKANGIAPGAYTVKRGDSLSVIAQRFGVSLPALKSSNGLSSNTIHIGQELTIPGGVAAMSSEHTIRRGETLSQIAESYQISLANLRQVNSIAGDRIMVGQVLKIPAS